MANVEQEVMDWLLGKLRYNATTNPDGIQDPTGSTSRTWIGTFGAKNMHGYPRITVQEVTDVITSPYIGARGEGNTYVKKHVITYQLDIYVQSMRNPITYLGKTASDGKLKAILSDEVMRVLNKYEKGAAAIDDDNYVDINWIDNIRRRNMDELDITESAKSENIPTRFRKVIDFEITVYDKRAIS